MNVNKTKVMISGESHKGVQNTGRWPCCVCGRGWFRRRLVGWSLTSLFSTNTALSETKVLGETQYSARNGCTGNVV